MMRLVLFMIILINLVLELFILVKILVTNFNIYNYAVGFVKFNRKIEKNFVI